MKYKVIEEYDYFYLCESEKGYKVCFSKRGRKPIDGYIEIKRPQINIATRTIDSSKVNRSFNESGMHLNTSRSLGDL